MQNQWGTFGGDNGYFWVSYNMIANNCCREIYIVYGATPSVPIAINGNDNLCSPSSGSYTINSLPCNANVSWTITDASGNPTTATVSPSTGIPVTVTVPSGLSYLNLKLTATILGVNPALAPIEKIIYIGQPYFGVTYKDGITDFKPVSSYTQNPNVINNVCMGYINPNVYLNVQPNGASNVTWIVLNGEVPPNFMVQEQTPSKVYFNWRFGGTNPVCYLKGNITNACGSFEQTYAFQQVNCGTTGPGGNPCTQAKGTNFYSISPNPAKENITISVSNRHAPIQCSRYSAITTDKGIIFSVVNVYDKLGTLKKSFKTSNVKQASIHISDLIAGSYVVEIIQNDYIERQQIIIQK